MTHWGSDWLSSWRITFTGACSFCSCGCAKVQTLNLWYIDDTLSSWLIKFVTYYTYRGVQLVELWMCEGRHIELMIFRWHIEFMTHWVRDSMSWWYIDDKLSSWLLSSWCIIFTGVCSRWSCRCCLSGVDRLSSWFLSSWRITFTGVCSWWSCRCRLSGRLVLVYRWVTAHVNELCHMWMSRGTCEWVVAHVSESCHM